MVVLTSVEATDGLCRDARTLVRDSRSLIAVSHATCDEARLARVHAREVRRRGPNRCDACRQVFATRDESLTVAHVPPGWWMVEETAEVHPNCLGPWIRARMPRPRRLWDPTRRLRGGPRQFPLN